MQSTIVKDDRAESSESLMVSCTLTIFCCCCLFQSNFERTVLFSVFAHVCQSTRRTVMTRDAVRPMHIRTDIKMRYNS